MLCFLSNKTLYDCDATVFLNVYSYLVFVGERWLALVPSHFATPEGIGFDVVS